MSDKRNPYHVLGLKKGATETEIKEAYKVLARKHHPDRNPNDPGARERFIEIKEAYEALIERKTASPVLAQVEETNAEFRRAGGYRKIAVRGGAVLGVVIIAAAAFVFREELEFRGRNALAQKSATAKEAEEWLAPIANGTGKYAVTARLDLVKRHIAAGDMEAATRLLSGADDPLGLALLGDTHVRAGRRDDARRAYEKAIGKSKSAETSARAYSGLVSMRDDAAAARVLSDAQARYPGDPWVQWMNAVRELRGSKPEFARRALDGNESAPANAVRAATLVTDARLLGGDVRRLDERRLLVEEAQKLLDKAKPEGTLGEFGWLRPTVEFLRKRPADWRPITSLESVPAAIDLTRSAAAAALGNDGHHDAVVYAERARKLDSASLEGLLVLGAAHLARGSKDDDDVTQARTAFSIARQADPKSARAAAGFALAVAASRPEAIGAKDDYEKELAAWKNALELEPDNAEWAYGYARSLARGGRERSAERISADRRAMKVAPDFGLPRLDLADALFDRNELGEAVRVLQQATTVPDVAAKAWKELGDYYYFAKQNPAALAAYRNAATDPDPSAQAAAWYGAAKTLGRLKKKKEAHEAIDRAIVLDRDMKPDHNDPAMAWVFSTYVPKTVELGEDAAVRAERRGNAHYKQKQYSEAYAAYYEASAIGDRATKARAYYGLARCSANMGNMSAAVLAMDNALKLDGALKLDAGDPGVQRLLATGYGKKTE